MTTAINSVELRSIAEGAARSVGDYLRKAFRGVMNVDQKRDQHDLVTEHDRACEEMISTYIREHNPGAILFGEEAGRIDAEGPATWYIDPIDGTSNFVQGLAFFCCSIGVEVDGEIVAGAVYDPMADNMFSADANGAYLNGESLKTNTALPAGAATVITGYPTAKDLEIDGDEFALGVFNSLVTDFSSVRRTGSGALSLCHVAAGWTDSAFGSSVNAWDVSAAMFVIRQAGGTYQDIRYSEEQGHDHLAPGYIAYGPGGDFPTLIKAREDLIKNRQR